MSNYSGNIELVTTIFDEKDLTEGIKEILSIDEDYSDVKLQEEIAEKIIKENETIDGIVSALLTYNGEEDISAFITGNDTYCKGYKYSIIKVAEGVHYVAVAYSL